MDIVPRQSIQKQKGGIGMKIPFKAKSLECKADATKDIAMFCKYVEESPATDKSDKKLAKKAKDAAKALDKFIYKKACDVAKKVDDYEKECFLERKNGRKPESLVGHISDSDEKQYRKLYKKLDDEYNRILKYEDKYEDELDGVNELSKCFSDLNPDR